MATQETINVHIWIWTKWFWTTHSPHRLVGRQVKLLSGSQLGCCDNRKWGKQTLLNIIVGDAASSCLQSRVATSGMAKHTSTSSLQRERLSPSGSPTKLQMLEELITQIFRWRWGVKRHPGGSCECRNLHLRLFKHTHTRLYICALVFSRVFSHRLVLLVITSVK